MSHPHIIIDADRNFIINPESRRVVSEIAGLKNIAQYDHDSERITFTIPRIVEGHDMALVDTIYIHFTNTDERNQNNVNSGIYESTDLDIYEDASGNEIAVFSWLVSRKATQYRGFLSFSIRFECHAEGEPIYVWNTAICNLIRIIPGLDNGQSVIDDNIDVLNEWRNRFFSDFNSFKADILVSLSTPALWPNIEENQLSLARSNLGIIALSQAEYDAIPEKNPNILYYIIDKSGSGTLKSIIFGDKSYTVIDGDVTIPMPSARDVGAIEEPSTKGGGQYLQWDDDAKCWVTATPTGSVTTVNGVGVTDGSTNIQLNAENVGARPNTWTPTAQDVGARPNTWMPTAQDVGAVPSAGFVQVPNKNLLDNPWFIVNQLGKTEYLGGQYTVDRWLTDTSSTEAVVIPQPYGIAFRIQTVNSLWQKTLLNTADYIGKQMTLSMRIGTGPDIDDVVSITTTISSGMQYDEYVYGSFALSILDVNGKIWVRTYSLVAGSYIGIRAMKLELGSVSTLSNDTAPDYATELRKCRRYLRYYDKAYYIYAGGSGNDTYYAPMDEFDPPLYRVPSISWSNRVYDAMGNLQTTAIYQVYETSTDRLPVFRHSTMPNVVYIADVLVDATL